LASKGKQKAAMLLINLDAATATELLRGLPPEDIQEIGMELVRLDTSDNRDRKEEVKTAQEFCNSLRQKQTERFGIRGFLNEMLVSVLGKEKAEQIQSQIRKATEKRDPFIAIRSASTDELVLALEDEYPQTIAVVLSELPPKKSQEVLSLLPEEARLKAVCKMTNPELLGGEVKRRIASMVSDQLKTVKGEALPEGREQTLRKLALMLSGLERELRDRLLNEIKKHNEETSTMVRNLMVTWEDILLIADRSLQEALRAVEASKLAVALYRADEEIAQKIRSNISERAAAMLDEEASLMQEPLEKEILDAREEITKPLREANEEGKLRFIHR
jgi:flagellar motor switch protein FliG